MDRNKMINTALVLAVITVFYNIIEGLASVYFGLEDETLSLFGFGLDSFIEVASGIGIWHMIIRMKKNENESSDTFEKTALKVTAVSFFILTAGLLLTVGYNIYSGHKPDSTFWGMVISVISIATMLILMKAKISTGKKLNSEAIIADAHCTRTCVYLSVVLLISSVLFQIFQIGYIDSLGALIIAYYSFKEGKESWDKAKGKHCCCSCNKKC